MTAVEAPAGDPTPARASVPGPGPSVVRRRRRLREMGVGYLLLLPALAVFGTFTFYPFLRNFDLALYKTPPFPNLPSHFVGLAQVGDVLSSHSFWSSMWDTVFFALMVVPASLLIGLLLAVAAHKKLHGIGIYRTVFSSTVVSSVAVATVIFGTFLDPVVGLLPWLGINPHPSVVESPTWFLPAIAALSTWQAIGLAFIVMSAGLQSLPEEVLEAARMDGASAWTRLWRVTVPLLSPTIFFTGVVGTIFAFQTFGQVDLLIGSQSPQFLNTNVLTYNIYNTFLNNQDPGTAAVLAIALFVVTLVLTLFQLRFLERRVHYGS